MGRWNDFRRMVAERRVGFLIDEVMAGTHEFEPEFGPPGSRPFEFRITWGVRHVSEFANPIGGKLGYADVTGFLDADGLCRDAPVVGSLELLYRREGKIRYTFTFTADRAEYLFIGEKRDIRPWNLHRTHTTCYGQITQAETGRLVSRAVVYFRLLSLPRFALSARLA